MRVIGAFLVLKKAQGTKSVRCALCWNEKFFAENPQEIEDCGTLQNEVILREYLLCKKHKEKMEETMDCSFCGSQDTTPSQGVSKKTGKPWKAVDCNEPKCKNEKGYPNRTFIFQKGTGGAFKPKVGGNVPKNANNGHPSDAVIKKLDDILKILKANFPEPEVLEKDDESTPF